MCLVGGMLRFSLQDVSSRVASVGARLRRIGRTAGWLACLYIAAIALAASALPTPTFQESSPVPASGLVDTMLIIGSVASLGATWTSTPRPLIATFEQGSLEASSTSAGSSNQVGDDGAGPLESQLEFVTIAGVAYNTGLDPDPATCGLAGGALSCVAVYDGLLEAALSWAHEAHYLVN